MYLLRSMASALKNNYISSKLSLNYSDSLYHFYQGIIIDKIKDNPKLYRELLLYINTPCYNIPNIYSFNIEMVHLFINSLWIPIFTTVS